MNDPGPAELILAGYVRLTGRGFALPCFATHPRANTWYTAMCSVDADHAGHITGFEVFTSDEILPLPGKSHRSVGIGSPWVDVFLWTDRVCIGTPLEIWSALGEEREQMLSAVPLTGLDIALSIPDQNVTGLVKAAHEFMRVRYGTDKAAAWRSGTLARQQILIGLKRLARAAGLGPETLSAMGGLVILPLEADQLQVRLPPAVVDQFTKCGRAADLENRLRETTERLGLTIAASVASIDAAAEAAPILSGWVQDTAETVEEPSRAVVRILIVASQGRRAREIARQFSHPEWTPEWLGHRRLTIEIETVERNASRPSRRFVSSERADDELMSSQHDVVVLLADDDDLLQPDSSLMTRVDGKVGKIRLLAPALPEDLPSEALTGEEFPMNFGKIRFDAMVDTAVARSPFWSGNARRSLDRRIADMILGAALLCSGDSPVGRQIRRHRRYQQSLLTFALAPGPMDSEMALASEATWVRTGLGKEQWSSGFVARSHRSDGHGGISGVVQLRERRAQFEDFAAAVLLRSAYQSVAAGVGPDASLPFKLRNELTRSDLAAGFFPGLKRFKGVALCAEAPTIAAVSAAGAQGWAVIRYTDQESIEELSRERHRARPPFLPHELRLPSLSRRPENRGLATRGIDPRDVIRLTSEEWRTWRARLPNSLKKEVRRYRASLPGSVSDSASAEDLEFLLPRHAVLQAAESGHREARTLLRQIDRRDNRDGRSPSPGKRLSDLRIAWSRPAEGASRYILADGVNPCKLAELEPEEVPAQRFFIIEGDAGVPALLGSRIFSVWARITLTRSMSWMPRFSVSRTFETFPVPPPFLLIRSGDGPAQLRLQGNRRLRSLAEELRRLYRRQSFDAATELHAEIDRLILEGLNLGEKASDLAMVELLLESAQNHRF